MTNKEAASRLKERVNDWQTYQGTAENPWSVPPPSESPQSSPAAESSVSPFSPAPDFVSMPTDAGTFGSSAESQSRSDVVFPPSAKPERANVHSHAATTVVEILPPDELSRRRPHESGRKRVGRRTARESELAGVLFPDARQAEAEYHHARRANIILNGFVVVLLGIVFALMAWMLVD